MKKLLLASLSLVCLSFAANGDVIPTLAGISANGNNTFTWNYSASVTVDQKVQTGDFFTIYDFGTIAPGSNTQPANWTFSSSLVGQTPPLLVGAAGLKDNPTLMNLTWTYTGAATIDGSQLLGMFSVQNTSNQAITGQFAAEATRSTGPQINTKIDNLGNVAVPVPEMSAVMPILGLCGIGALSFATSLWRRRHA